MENNKISRVLSIYNKLCNGEIVNKSYEADKYGVNERTIQRDIEDIREYLGQDERSGTVESIIYDRGERGHRLENLYDSKLRNSEILAVCKILLDSRAFTKKEMDNIIEKLVDCCAIEGEQEAIRRLIANGQYHYIEPQHKSEFLDTLWQVGQAIREQRYIEIGYVRMKDKKEVRRIVKPAAIMFSEFYFYLAAFIEDEETKKDFEVLDDAYPTIYRIDRIRNLTVLKDVFRIPYSNRFEEGEFRKRVQFMYGGKLQRIKFKYFGYSVEAVLDRLPTAKILAEKDGVFTISAEVFGKGIEMWLRSQGENVEVMGDSI